MVMSATGLRRHVNQYLSSTLGQAPQSPTPLSLASSRKRSNLRQCSWEKVDGRETAFSYYNAVSLPAEPSAFDTHSDTLHRRTRRYPTDSGPMVSRRKWAIQAASQYTAIHEKN